VVPPWLGNLVLINGCQWLSLPSPWTATAQALGFSVTHDESICMRSWGWEAEGGCWRCFMQCLLEQASPEGSRSLCLMCRPHCTVQPPHHRTYDVQQVLLPEIPPDGLNNLYQGPQGLKSGVKQSHTRSAAQPELNSSCSRLCHAGDSSSPSRRRRRAWGCHLPCHVRPSSQGVCASLKSKAEVVQAFVANVRQQRSAALL
jgi:hypothetical protein